MKNTKDTKVVEKQLKQKTGKTDIGITQKQKKQQLRIQRKISKLKKVKIWPYVLFFVLTLITAIAAVSIVVTVFAYYLFQEKFANALQLSKSIEIMIDNHLAEDDNYEQALAFLGKEEDMNAVAILDQNNEFLAGYGEMSYDLQAQGIFEFGKEYEFLLDQNSREKFDSNGKFILDIPQMLNHFFVDNKGEDIDWMNKEVYYEPYWLILKDNSIGVQVMVRHVLTLSRKDIIFIGGVGIGIFVVMSIPILFLFFYLFSSVIKQRRMYRLLSIDSVTGGNNWLNYSNRAEKILNRYINVDKLYAVIHLSYGKYRSFCSCYGVNAGEKLLQQLDQFLSKHLQRGELVAHISEADFAVLIQCNSREETITRILSWFHEIPNIIPECKTSFSAGVCMVNVVEKSIRKKTHKRREADISQLFHNASIARDTIAQDEEKSVIFFDDKMKEQQLWEHRVEANMEQALVKEEFQIYLQPKYNPVTEEISGAEALVRWINEEDGFVAPYRFIPIFEKNGFIIKLDDYMISHVAALQSRWLMEGKKVVPVSVNVSRAHFTRPDLAAHICKLVDQYQLPHELLEIELTESAFFDDKEVLLSTVNALKEYGFLVSMDDFGAGYSSLNSLKELPLDILKLDAEFFRGKYEQERGDIVVSEAINLAKKLNMKIVAEGIEEKEQVTFLAGLGCDMIQGYYFAKPMPSNEFELKLQ